ncbi:helix-turn-helix transcriptional regulator [Collinsella phocaeensis]|uniref:helix-turn-helix transcriptional regulator n=1 Tax=Collinsella phocaeensis TaxID=1871016 RepID=UPI000931BA58|nr:helix-turn-helix transcriptional regulator [Collinsella phocaeensis]
MSFRTNLQYLRAERHMTQEQLAMLLGVSRQSVTKWKAEGSYPEMDKLIKMCQIFECSLDDLVTGDVSRHGVPARDDLGGYSPVRAPSGSIIGEEPAAPMAVASWGAQLDTPVIPVRSFPVSGTPTIPAGPATDVCGYDEHMVTFARKIAIGVVLFILGAAAAIFTDEVMHSDGIVLLAAFAFVAAGLAFTIPAGIDHAAFVKAHPYVADFYTADEKATARRRASIAIVAGIAVILLGVAVAGLFEVESNVQVYGNSLMMVLAALGVGMIVHWGMLWGRTDLADYNKEWLETVELSDDELAQLDQQSREAYLRANNPRRRGVTDRKGKACMVIMLVATMVALVWLFAASVMGASEGVSGLFWLPWVVGSLGSGIALIVIDDDDP